VEKYTNALPTPDHHPLRPPGVSYPVILRLVLENGSEQWWPGKTVKWIGDAVMVSWESEPGNPRSNEYVWLAARDVRCVIHHPSTSAGVGPAR